MTYHRSANAAFFELRKPRHIWGDYGRILQHGMADHLRRDTLGRLQLERTGPYIADVTFPHLAIIVTDAMKARMQAGPFASIEFAPVHKARIVRLDWHLWDQTAGQPAEYPPGNEPENYILGRRHSPALADQLGPLWEVVLPVGAKATAVQTGPKRWNVKDVLLAGTWTGLHWFRVRTHSHYVSESGKEWFEQHAPGLVRFEPAETTSG